MILDVKLKCNPFYATESHIIVPEHCNKISFLLNCFYVLQKYKKTKFKTINGTERIEFLELHKK